MLLLALGILGLWSSVCGRFFAFCGGLGASLGI